MSRLKIFSWQFIYALRRWAFCSFILFEEGEAEGKKMSERTRGIVRLWALLAVQFAFGGLLSVFLVFYFRSGSFITSWPFFALLLAAFIANERLKEYYSRLVFQLSMLFLSIYAFAIYIVPVLLHRIGQDVFLLSGVLSIILIALFTELLWLIAREHFAHNRKALAGTISGLLIVINGLYFLNLIPPLPLSLEDSGVFHLLNKEGGSYAVTHEVKDTRSYFSLYEPVHIAQGDSLFVYSAVFSPADLNPGIIHEWQHYDSENRIWIMESRIPLSVIGGRSGGFRTYSEKSNILPGKWRVNVEDAKG
jgi:hypothetical protein